MKQVYPTFVNTKDGQEHPFLVCVSDMGIFTEGDTFADAIEQRDCCNRQSFLIKVY